MKLDMIVAYTDMEVEQLIMRKALIEILTHRNAIPVIAYTPSRQQDQQEETGSKYMLEEMLKNLDRPKNEE